MKELDFVSLLASRICHDLAGPIGALGNGVELLREDADPEMRESALDLMEQSLAQAFSRLRMYRLALGQTGGSDIPIPLGDAHKAAADYFSVGRIRLNWALPEDSVLENVEKGRVRLLLALFLVAETAIPRGGEIRFNGDFSHPLIEVEGRRLALPENMGLAMDKGESNGDPKAVPAVLVHLLAASEGLKVRRETGEGELMRVEIVQSE